MTTQLPANANLEFARKQAKAILKAHKSGDTSCCPVLKNLSQFENRPDADILTSKVGLQEVQFALAMEYGFRSWQDLRAAIVSDAYSTESKEAAMRTDPKMDLAYPLRDLYSRVISMIRETAPSGLSERSGVSRMHGGEDFRLCLDRYRVIGAFPNAERVTVYMDWSYAFENRHLFEDDADFITFEDAHGYLRIDDRKNEIWNIYDAAILGEPYARQFLESGMRLMVKKLVLLHPRLS